MPTDEQFAELQRLVATLTERVYRLEQALAARPRPSVAPRQPSPAPQAAVPQRDADLEAKIGGQWLNRIGIIAVLIGVSYFLKYAFDNQWIGAAGRVLIGLTGGLGIVLWSEYVRRSGYAVFSYSLKAIGIGILYLSLWAASQLYQLIPNGLAFLSMIAVTAATAGLALWENAQVLAAFAALGGFLTPVVLSTGVNNAVGLFSYLLVLDAGALLLARFRPWTELLIGSYVGTLLLYSSWHAAYYTPDQFSLALLAISALFVAFAAVPFVARDDGASWAFPLLALLNAATFFFEVWELFNHDDATRQAAVAAVALAALFFLMAWQLRRESLAVTADIHWAIGAAFLIVAVPIGLDSPWISAGWFVEGAALLRVNRRHRKDYLDLLGCIALSLGTLRLLAFDRFEVERVLFNQRMLIFAIAIAALLDVIRQLDAARNRYDRYVMPLAVIVLNVLALFALTVEITDEWSRQVEGRPEAYATMKIVRDFAYSAAWMAYGAALMIAGFWKKSQFLRWQALVLIGVTVAKVFFYDTSSLDRGYRILSLLALGLLLLATSFLYQRSTRTARIGNVQPHDDSSGHA